MTQQQQQQQGTFPALPLSLAASRGDSAPQSSAGGWPPRCVPASTTHSALLRRAVVSASRLNIFRVALLFYFLLHVLCTAIPGIYQVYHSSSCSYETAVQDRISFCVRSLTLPTTRTLDVPYKYLYVYLVLVEGYRY